MRHVRDRHRTRIVEVPQVAAQRDPSARLHLLETIQVLLQVDQVVRVPGPQIDDVALLEQWSDRQVELVGVHDDPQVQTSACHLQTWAQVLQVFWTQYPFALTSDEVVHVGARDIGVSLSKLDDALQLLAVHAPAAAHNGPRNLLQRGERLCVLVVRVRGKPLPADHLQIGHVEVEGPLRWRHARALRKPALLQGIVV